MNHALFRFYDQLNFFLSRSRKNKRIEHPFEWTASIKDMIESLGVPHPEIDLIVVNGQSVGFDYLVQPDDVVEVYPSADVVELANKIILRPPYGGRPCFVLDTHLGRLAAYLRMTGFDTLYRNDYPDDELALVSNSENRILLTRDTGLLKRSLVTYGYYVRETKPKRRLVEIVRRYDLSDQITPFKYCMKCNGLLEAVDKAAILERLPQGTAAYYDEFHRCQSCDHIYWKGNHYQKMQELITRVLNTVE